MGPIRETAGPDHRCGWAELGLAKTPCLGETGRLWHLFGDTLKRAGAIIDMGGSGGDEYGCKVPWAMNWDLADGHDMRDIDDIYETGRRFDLVWSSHSIEHVPSVDVPQMLTRWWLLLKPGGLMVVIAPHRWSSEWSPLVNGEGHCTHLWAPTCASVGNFLYHELNMELVMWDDHYCRFACFFVVARRIG